MKYIRISYTERPIGLPTIKTFDSFSKAYDFLMTRKPSWKNLLIIQNNNIKLEPEDLRIAAVKENNNSND